MRPNSTIIFNFNLNKILITKWFNIQQCLNHKLKDYETNFMHPIFIKGFPMAPRTWKDLPWSCCGLGALNKTNKTSKLPLYIDYPRPFFWIFVITKIGAFFSYEFSNLFFSLQQFKTNCSSKFQISKPIMRGYWKNHIPTQQGIIP